MKTLIVSTILAFAAMTPIAEAGEIWRASGFEQPESALFDAANKRIIVSNIAGNPGEADGNGYLSVLSLDGKLVTRHWTDGMDAPKGMALSGGKLYVADITKVRVVDLASGKLVASIDVPNAVFLNDMTADSAGKVYVSDMLADTIYRIDGDRPELFVKDALLASPNGIFADGGRLIVASWGKGIKPDFSTAEPGGLLSVDLASKAISPLPGAEKFADLDGVVAIGDSIYATAYMTGTLYRYKDGGKPEAFTTFKPGSADIGADGKTIFVPLMNEGEVAALSLD
ncbi:ATP/GTP-binding protein [Mesorhizobium sp. M4B.F.Ca.ET.215.01.1.1]|uniref:SMP-30/gluconolactonase/LRE family protein n=1 Tax=unclassified Mesorhizobium TaxID=325217 RepID=UPI000FCB327A|nr:MULTISPECIES: ATP/GTP-binding protein [unclassified Mesorhizobium]RUW27862.1 ATP/GTP-binding protein [Mesorhizobium sp. M4B.F.Ca.ET.013.02.1.1]RVD44762.1 ATP/GTP-binding protein [Mesorhizobium sp. M4B.F.Ca.ET.019.03.1.1]RWX68485.1 ATP/GTP-binding protein [Mesorhizobium sp. M4B.F.Ca.ET.089.01.1.1]TGQ04665.1 ATP/GTP-binding protein [Mesorhizobium sp. M4B.F.Ca.ET.215.01.1.1]TGQ27830.1 ATP/GTP-binding protein [Mesorhizobium sp. M00.F.Ca.ET.220.01.1.1]